MDLNELKGITVFIVDDNPNNLSVIKDHLIQYGIKPIPLKSGEAAISLIEKVKPDIILMDVQMTGGIDGFEACRKIKNIESVREIPVIFISAVSETVDKVNGFTAGGVDYIAKPIVADELLSRIYVHTKIYKLQEELKNSRDNLEQKVIQRTLELSSYKDYLKNIINSMASIVVGIDSSLKVIEWNQKAEEFSGVNRERAIGKSVIELIPILDKENSFIDESIGSLQVKRRERKRFNNGGKTEFYDIFIFPLDTSGSKGAVIRIDDITNRVYMEEVMIQSEKMMSIGGLAAGMAHEINNPLAAIIQTIGVIENRLVKKLEMDVNRGVAEDIGLSLDHLREYLQRRNIKRLIINIKDACVRLSKIVNNMLGFVSKKKTNYSLHSITEIMDECIELSSLDYNMKKKYDFKLIEIVKEYGENLPYIPCDKTKIEQVFINLLQNGAMEMNKISNGDQKFYIRIVEDDGSIVIEIEDSGPGIDNEIKKKVFDPFFTTKPPGIGTGLGLSISYYIVVQEHHGQISVGDSSYGGAKFTIKLPLNIS